MTYLFTSLVFNAFFRYYEYWFNPNSSMGEDILDYVWFIFANVLCLLMFVSHCFASTLIWFVQILPLSSIILWWPKFYAAIILDPDGRSLLDILRDPQFRGSGDDEKLPKPFKPSRYVRRNFIDKQKRRVSVAHSKVHSLSSYTSLGAYAHLGQIQDQNASRAIHIASNNIVPSDPLWLHKPYVYVAERIPDLPDTVVTRCFAVAMIVGVFACTLGSRLIALIVKDFNEEQQHVIDGTLFDRDEGNTSKVNAAPNIAELFQHKSTALSTDHANNSSTTLFDTDGITFVIDNSATCIVCNDRSQFIGQLRKASYGVETANGTSSSSWVGTIRITLTDDSGKSFKYQIPDAIYSPSSPFNILGIPVLGDFFGKNDPIPSSDDEGTFVTSSANQSVLTWDHGKHLRHFTHSDKRLPELVCESGYTYFQAFASRINRAYSDKVHFAFSSAHTKHASPDATQTSRATSVTPGSPFQLGEEIVYTDGAGNSQAVVYEGESVNGNHIIRTEDGSKVVTPDAHLKLYDQPDLTNVPRTPLEYCKEIKHLTQDELKELVYPRKLSPVQQEFLSWHNRLFHMPFWRMNKLAKLGILPKRFMKCTNMLCVSCQFGKAHRRPWRTRVGQSSGIRKRKEKRPGDGTSVDQIVSAQPGLKPQMAGTLTSERIWGATVFVDHVTDYVYCHLMTAFSLDETLNAKTAYEKLLAQMGHKAKHFRADNGRFSDRGFMKSVQDADQTIDFCAVGHHGQNGIVEHKNKMLTLGARTLLLHGTRMWPQMIDSMFWPFALKAYAEQMNCLHVDDDGQTPESKITGVRVRDLPVGNYHTLFCPVYVLDSRLHSAGGPGPPKWEPRSRIGVYCGHSPLHAGNVALVFNPRTGRVSPQFHCVFDDEFSTVPYMEKGEIPPNWEDLCLHSFESAEDESVVKALNYLSTQTGAEQAKTDEMLSLGMTSAGAVPAAPKDPLSDPFAVSFDQQLSNSNPSSTNRPDRSASEGDDLDPRHLEQQAAAAIEPAAKRQRKQEDDNPSPSINLMTDFGAESDADQEQSDMLFMPERVNLHEAGLRRSKRVQEKNAKQAKAHVTFGRKCATTAITLFALLTSIPDTKLPSHQLPDNPTRWNRIVNRFEEINEHCDGTLNDIHHLVLATEASNETYTYSQAMKQDDRLMFIKAMEKEIEDHEERKHWKLVHRSSIKPGTKRIKAIWSFKRKRYPDGSLNKHKARICCHGGQQEYGVNYWETYSPVVNALTVKLLLVVAKLHGLSSKSIDFVLAFPQAEVDAEIYMDLPIGFEPEFGSSSDYSLLLLRNLYGLKQGSYNWYQKLKTGLIARGFAPSKIDPCLYLRKGMIVLTYVDDCIIVGKSVKEIDEFIKSLQGGKEDFILTDEGNIDKFLGVEIVDRGRGQFEMKQPHLIDRIVQALGLKDNQFDCHVNEKKTPANTVLLNRDLEGKPRKKSWNYRQLVGMLGYLQANTRPDISMPTHQCARFCIDPKLSHEQAITRIGRYLRDTSDKGIIYKPDKSKGLEVFVDADFAGGWNKTDPHDVDSLYSRAGYVIKYAGCPVYWKSKLMNSEMALSTAEAEFMALSIALREVIPLMTQMEEMNEVFPLHIDKPNFHCKVWEDNQSCIAMTRRHHFTPRTKHIALKYYHFMSHVGTRIRINYVHTESQEADIFTKPVKDHLFFPLRFMLMGW